MVERFTQRRTTDNRRGYYDGAISLASRYAACRSSWIGNLGNSQQTGQPNRTDFVFCARARNHSSARLHQENQENSERRQSFGSATQKCIPQKRLRQGTNIAAVSFEDFLKQEGFLENVQAAAFKRALALKVNDMMKEKRMNKSAMAARMRTSRAAVHRLLDPKNTSVTLATLNRAARSLGCKVKIEFVPA